VWDRQLPSYVTRWKTIGFVPHEEAKHVEAGRLGQGRKGKDDIL
jgi:hypothetical protein